MQPKTSNEIKIPISVKAPLVLIGLLAFFTVLYIAKVVIVPLIIATIIAIVLHPVVNVFVRMRINRVIGIIITLFLTFLFFASLGLLL